MGADIHVFLEYQSGENDWSCGDFFFLGEDSSLSTTPIYTARNYALFDILQECIPQNAVPKNMSTLVKNEVNRWTGSLYGLNNIMVSDLFKIWTEWEEKEVLDLPAGSSGLWYNNGYILAPFIQELMRNIDFIKYRAPYPIGLNALRIVYFFDR